MGQLQAETLTCLVEMDTDLFRQLVLRDGGPIFRYFRIFAVFFVEYAEEKSSEENGVITDLPLPEMDVENMIRNIYRFSAFKVNRHDASVNMINEGALDEKVGRTKIPLPSS